MCVLVLVKQHRFDATATWHRVIKIITLSNVYELRKRFVTIKYSIFLFVLDRDRQLAVVSPDKKTRLLSFLSPKYQRLTVDLCYILILYSMRIVNALYRAYNFPCRWPIHIVIYVIDVFYYFE